jgi:hypothetical protein
MDVGLLAVENSCANLRSVDNQNGTFSCSVDLIGSGNKYELSFKINGEDLSSPWTFST